MTGTYLEPVISSILEFLLEVWEAIDVPISNGHIGDYFCGELIKNFVWEGGELVWSKVNRGF